MEVDGTAVKWGQDDGAREKTMRMGGASKGIYHICCADTNTGMSMVILKITSCINDRYLVMDGVPLA